MEHLPREVIDTCKRKLLEAKMDILNRVRSGRETLAAEETSGDEADQTMRIQREAEYLGIQDRLRHQLLEIESALARIQNGTYGICEETEEIIEKDRLLAIPWTRLSIEGAELREAMNKRYAKS